jgi:hypothetical protein
LWNQARIVATGLLIDIQEARAAKPEAKQLDDGSFSSSLLSSYPDDHSRSRKAVGRRRRASIMCLHLCLSGLARQARISMMLSGKQIPVLA